MEIVDVWFGYLNTLLSNVLFFDILWFMPGVQVPFVVAWLVAGAVFFTLRMGFINVRAFKHAIDLARGKYDTVESQGEVTHFKALATALSATVGLGNIAGVAIAISIGGPGATFWMITAGVLGMSSKFAECTLGQMYRTVTPQGHVMGGAMMYLSDGFREMGWAKLGKALAAMFAVICIGGSLAGGNSFQVNQSLSAVQETFPFFATAPWAYGLIMAILVAIVILGGITRIASTAEKIVPLMCIVYVLACLWVILEHVAHVPDAFAAIVSGAFTPEAGYGGIVGVLVVGFQRAAFSNEAGVGSAAIAHAAAKTKHPVEEGIVALLEPFIDTVLICTMTALVIVITGAYNNPAYADLIEARQGAALTSRAFGEILAWFPVILSISVIFFAYSTIISWSYYGERCWSYLFGEKRAIIYRWISVAFVMVGAITSATNMLNLGDSMILGMAVPNLFGAVLLSGKIRAALDDYLGKLKSGELFGIRS